MSKNLFEQRIDDLTVELENLQAQHILYLLSIDYVKKSGDYNQFKYLLDSDRLTKMQIELVKLDIKNLKKNLKLISKKLKANYDDIFVNTK